MRQKKSLNRGTKGLQKIKLNTTAADFYNSKQ